MENNKAPLKNLQPGVFILITLVSVFITYQIFGGALTLFITGMDMDSSYQDSEMMRLVLSFSQFMFILAPVLLLNYLQGGKFKETFRIKFPDIFVFVLSIAGIVIVQPFLQAFAYFQNKLIFSIPYASDYLNQLKELFDKLESITLNLVKAENTVEFIFVVFVIALTPAICEEFLFRGLILSNFNKITKPNSAIFLTGLIFAAFHFHPFNLFPLIMLGCYITFTVYYSGSIFTAIAVHFLNNFISAYAVYTIGKENFTTPDITGIELFQFVLLGMFSFILFIIVIKLILTSYKKKKINFNV